MNIDDIDIIGLRVFRAVFEARHVGRAAEELGLGQPAVSYHLRRLRAHFGDPLFVRDARGVRPTARALALAPRIAALLAAADTLGEPEAFEPSRIRREIRIASLDYERIVLLAGVVARVGEIAPGARVALVPRTARDYEALADGALDLVVGPRSARMTSGYLRRQLYTDEVTCVTAAGHPLALRRRPPTLADWVAHPHVTVIVEGTAPNEVDTFLARRGMSRRTLARVAGFEAACAIVAASHMIALVPRSLASRARSFGLAVLRSPLTPRSFGVYATWHEAVHEDPLHVWLRGLVVEAGRSVNASRRSGAPS